MAFGSSVEVQVRAGADHNLRAIRPSLNLFGSGPDRAVSCPTLLSAYGATLVSVCPGQNPPDRVEDVELELIVSSHLELVHNPPLIKRVMAFFSAFGETERAELAQALRSQASQALRNWRDETLASVLSHRLKSARGAVSDGSSQLGSSSDSAARSFRC